ncbi:sulfite exporter TauE/SafE family protein [Cochlodiniinecator piscidefendens]|uniref:sulfite exporter TauE/SafE family protein n=1 Tax=Cochlodiniinecator piscidefendens TaxID=2715756 RepID=UPI0014099732|nr:sulfite exporter TauE/SafE family protein [Cochlodiniinecator piscidefendens]
MSDIFLLIIAGFGAGIVNALAGGGTFLTFPALVFIGIPPVAANATSAVAVFPGYLAAALGFREEISAIPRSDLLRACLASLLGGLVGGLLLLVSSNEIFALLVPFLLLIATLAFAFQNFIQKALSQSGVRIASYGWIGLMAVSIYGGYFNGGLGIVLLALYALWGMKDLNQMNGLKNAMSFVISAISVATFAIAGIVHWPEALIMALAAIAGGFAGARLAKVLPTIFVRGFVILMGFGMAFVFFGRLMA